MRFIQWRVDYEINKKKELKEDFGFYPIWTGNSGLVANTATDKLGQLEDIEEELGIDLATLFKALKDAVVVKDNDDKVLLWLEYDNDFYFYDLYNHKIYLKDYGKTWVLTKEELEKC